MVGKFAVMLCPEPKCVKISSNPKAVCPTHDKAMVRTVVMTQGYVDDHNKITKTFDSVLKGFKAPGL